MSARPGLSTFTIEGRAPPGPFVVGWLASLLGGVGLVVYGHLDPERRRVHVGQHVRVGQVIALSGDTGFTSGPHLHFCVQVNSDMQLVAVPFQFTAAGATFTPVQGQMLGGD